jgi:5-methylcytosine-specific restriction endonuclease McrA
LIVGKLRPEYDHVSALINGGQHRESNIQLLCSACHKVKTKADVAEKSDAYRKQLNAAEIRKSARLEGQGFRKAAPQRSASRPIEKRCGA